MLKKIFLIKIHLYKTNILTNAMKIYATGVIKDKLNDNPICKNEFRKLLMPGTNRRTQSANMIRLSIFLFEFN